MSSIDPQNNSLLPELESKFWAILRDALEIVLGADGELADRYRRQLQSASRSERLLALHDDPEHPHVSAAPVSSGPRREKARSSGHGCHAALSPPTRFRSTPNGCGPAQYARY